MTKETMNGLDTLRYVYQRLLSEGKIQRTDKWQGKVLDEKTKFFEAFGISFQTNMNRVKENLGQNMPWAEDHFLERVSGLPLNPGNEYKNWPYYKNNPSNDTSRVEEGKFSHSYMERYWPRFAGHSSINWASLPDPENSVGNIQAYKRGPITNTPNRGIRYEYGDLKDVVNHLAKDPYTRQAYLPIWFPEDTGVVFKGRVPCTLGYLFIMRENKLHITYYIRSCDLLRHFRDDVYLTTRLAEWVLEQLQSEARIGLYNWNDVELGNLTMHIANLHIFDGEQFILAKFLKDYLNTVNKKG